MKKIATVFTLYLFVAAVIVAIIFWIGINNVRADTLDDCIQNASEQESIYYGDAKGDVLALHIMQMCTHEAGEFKNAGGTLEQAKAKLRKAVVGIEYSHKTYRVNDNGK